MPENGGDGKDEKGYKDGGNGGNGALNPLIFALWLRQAFGRLFFCALQGLFALPSNLKANPLDLFYPFRYNGSVAGAAC